MPKSKAKGGDKGFGGKGRGFASREEQSDASGRNVFTTALPIYKVKEKKNRLDVVEFKVKKYERNAKKGDTFHSLVYFVHENIGPGGKTIVCPKTKGDSEPCPVCEHQYNLFRTKGKEAAKGLRHKKRIAQLVRDRDDKEKGLQLFPHAYNKGYGEALEKRLNGDDEGKYDNWSDAKKGYYVSFTGTKESVGDDGGSWITTSTVDLEPRKEDVSKLMKSAPSLDDLLDEIPSYEKLKKMLAAGKSPKKEDDDDDEDEDTDDEDDTDDDDDSDEDDDEEDDDGDEEDEDDEDGDGEDDEEGDEDEDDDSEEDDEDEEALEKGDKVSHGKGKKKREGVIVKLKGANANVKFGKKIETVKLSELTAVEDDDDDDDDEELDDDSDIEDDDDDEEDDDDFEADDDDEEDDDDDDDEDDDEEAVSKPKKRRKK